MVVVDRLAIEEAAVDVVGVDVVGVDGVTVDGVVDIDLLATETKAVGTAEYKSEFDVNPSVSGAMHQLPAFSLLFSTQVELCPFLLKKVTRPVWFTCIQATGEPFSVPHTSTLSAKCCSLSSSKLLATAMYILRLQ